MKVAGVTLSGTTQRKLGSFTRDMQAVSGDVSYTGVGFMPDLIIFFAQLSNSSAMSWTIHDGVLGSALDMIDVSTGGNPSVWSSAGKSIYLTAGSGKIQDAIVKTRDADGFTLTWTKTGSPDAGTASIYYLAIKF